MITTTPSHASTDASRGHIRRSVPTDRGPAITATLVTAVRASDGQPLQVIRDLLVGPGPLGGFGARLSEQQAFWRLIAGSRVLQARARELAEQMEAALAKALAEANVAEPALAAALLAAAYRTVHLDAIRRVLAGEPPAQVDADRAARLTRALGAVERALTIQQSE